MFGGTKRRLGVALGFAASAVALAAVMPAHAADLNGGAYADLEERIAELEATTARKGNRKVSLTVSGVVNEALLAWDDGRESNVYVVTNEEYQDRFRFAGEAEITKGWKAGYLIEIGIRGSREDRVNQDTANGSNPDGRDGVSTRHSAWWLSSKDYGKLWAGLTSDAADGITEINLANTNHFASSNKQYLGDSGNNGFFALHNGQRSNIKWGLFASPPGLAQQPGEGHRENLIKYETPTIAGFVGSAAWGEDDLWNLALRYKGEFSGFKFAAGIAYSEVNGGNPNNIKRGISDTNELGLSASLQHSESGLYVTGAYGHLEDENLPSAFDKETDFYFIQAGIERKFIPVGKTTLFGEYWNIDRGTGDIGGSLQSANVPGFPAGFVGGTSLEGWGLGLNQNFSEFFDLYLLYNHVSADFNVVTAGGAQLGNVSVDDFDYVVGGAQIKF
jgi:hypothetical protein